MKRSLITFFAVLCFAGGGNDPNLSPYTLAASADGSKIYIACATANKVLVFDTAARKITGSIAVPATPTGLALSPDGARLYVTCAAPASTIAIVDTVSRKPAGTLPAGHTAMGPAISPDGRTLYVCNRFDNDVAAIDLAAKKEIYRAKVLREPIAEALTPDGKLLFVANQLPVGRADGDFVAAAVTVLEAATGKTVKQIALPNGSSSLEGIALSPDGKFAAVTHILGHINLPPTQLERGWMNTNALSIIDVAQVKLLNTVLLDNVDSGAANPWAVSWSKDGSRICVTHAGTDEVSVLDAPGLIAKLKKSASPGDVPNDLSFLLGLQQRIKLDGKGPRGLALVKSTAYVSNYFSDSLSVVDLASSEAAPVSIALGTPQEPSMERRGESLFHDATIAFQGWQSCSSCHPDGRSDAMHWDLLNDGIGNPKNTKSMLYSHRTPPAMSQGVRESAEIAVRSGLEHILFASRPESEAEAIDEYLKSLRPVPSPYLVNGEPTAAALRGKKLFYDPQVGCASCHGGELFTDLQSYDVGTGGPNDKSQAFDTPTLIENWRTAPYLHDGRAASMFEVLRKDNPHDKHGKTSRLTDRQLKDLAEFVLSL
jgi:YVTN family beta-propeller protein